MELKQAIKVCKVLEDFTNKIDMTVPMSDLMILGELNPHLADNIDFLNRWINNDVTFEVDIPTTATTETTEVIKAVSNKEPWLSVAPDADWRKVRDMNLMISNYGHVWNIDEKKLMKQHLRDGDMRITLGSDVSRDTRRVSVLVAKAFQIRSPDRSSDFIIEFKDGDRRNLKVDNIYWKKPTGEYVETRRYMIEDICRRILQYDGDIEKIMPLYEDAYPSVSKASVEQIKDKKLFTEISDLFFVNLSGKIYPRTDAMAVDTDANQGMDVGGFFRMSGDKKLTGELIRDKIKRGDALSLDEKVITVFMAMDVIGINKANDVKKISNVIKNTFGCDIGYDFISQIVNDYTSDIAEMFREGER